jgi:hypothetical protein
MEGSMIDASEGGNRSDSAFRWNFGGWFGSNAGSMAWMVWPLWSYCEAGDVVGAGAMLTLIVAFAFAAVLSWMRRDRLSAYVALQSTVVGLGLAGLVAMELAQVRPMPVELSRWLPIIPLMAAGLFVRFWLMERSAAKASGAASYDA